MTTPIPGTPAPDLAVDLVGGGGWKLADQTPDAFTMIVFYRGYHCPVCRKYAKQLGQLADDFRELGVEIISVSMDDEARATKTVDEWDTGDVPVGYGLSVEQAEAWGLYLSSAIKDGEPELFSEPGLFLVTPEGELFYAAVNSMPFGRPELAHMRDSIRWILDNDYPSRGRVADPAA